MVNGAHFLSQEDVQEDYGWKLVHGDVFRPPTHPMLLSVLVGSGMQLVAMTGLVLGKYMDEMMNSRS